MRKRSRIQSLSLCVGGLALTGVVGKGYAQNVSGNFATTQVNYGASVPGTGALGTQTFGTGFGDSSYTAVDSGASAGQFDANGSELDAGYGTVSGGYLYVFLAGNIENNGNLINIFIDDGRTGQNTLAAPNGAGNMQAMNGSVFSPGFNATYALEINDFQGTMFIDQYKLTAGGTASFVGSVGLNHTGIGASQNVQSSGIKLGLNNSNTAGVDGTPTDPAVTASVEAVTTGLEIGIPLATLGSPTGNIKVLADINGGGDGFLSNQFLPGLPAGNANVGTAGGPYSGTTSSQFNLSSLPNFWMTVPNTVVANGIWIPTGGSTWNLGTNWTNGHIPGGVGDSASFSSATGDSTVTLDGSRTVGSIVFNSSFSYTIAQGSGGSLTLDNGGASATAEITDAGGDHTISAPIILTSNAAISVQNNGDTMTISGSISGAGSLTVSSLGTNGRLNTLSQVVLSGTNSYGGGTTIAKGTLQLGSSGALPTGTALTLDANDAPAATLDLNNFNATVSSITSNGSGGGAGTVQITNTSPSAGTATLTYAGNAAAPDTFPGNITDNSGAGGGVTAITVSSGSLTLSGGSNTYTGTTTIKSGATMTFASATVGGTAYPSGGNTVNDGSLVINDSATAGTISGAGTTTVGAGQNVHIVSFTQGGLVNNGALDIFAGGTTGTISGNGILELDSGTLKLATNSGASTQSVLFIQPGATLDLNNNHFIINYAADPNAGGDPIASIISMIDSGYAGGSWTGTGITSSLAASIAAANLANPLTNPALSYGIGYADSADPGNPVGLAAGTLELKYTLLGDANLDGKVNGTDFAILATNFNQAVTSWDAGDFNYDGKANGSDFAFIAGNFNQGASAASDIAALDAFAAANGLLADVPEPTAVALAVAGTVGVLMRRRRGRTA